MEYHKAVFTDISDETLYKAAKLQIQWMINQIQAMPEQEQRQCMQCLLKDLETKCDE